MSSSMKKAPSRKASSSKARWLTSSGGINDTATAAGAAAEQLPARNKRRKTSQSAGTASTSTPARRHTLHEPDESERALAVLLFGGGAVASDDADSSDLADLVKPAAEAEINDSSDVLFDIDTTGTDSKPTSASSSSAAATDAAADDNDTPAWHDADDENVRVDITSENKLRKLRSNRQESVISGTEYIARLKYVYDKLNPVVEWATKAVEEQKAAKTEDASAVSAPTPAYTKTKSAPSERVFRLTAKNRPNHLSVQPLKDANCSQVSHGVIHALGWHPDGQLMFTAGMDKSIRLYAVDGTRNKKVQGVNIRDLPIKCASMSHDGEQIIATGRRPYFYTYHLHTGTVERINKIRGYENEKSLEEFSLSPDGKLLAFQCNYGYVPLVDTRTKQWVGDIHVPGNVRATAWAPDSQQLYTFGNDSVVQVFDIRRSTGIQAECIAKHHDDAGPHGTALTVSKDGKYYATGADSGVVNVYTTDSLRQYADGHSKHLYPVKALTNLTTPIDELVYNHDTNLLAISSRRTLDALRLYNVSHKYSAFANWPTGQTPLHYVTATAFSPHSGYITVANDRGRVLLYRIKPYASV